MDAGSWRTEGKRAMSVSEWTGITQAAISLLMVGVVWAGIVVMRRAGDQRSKREDQHHVEAMAAHREVMASHKEVMTSHAASHTQAMRALEALIERTGR